MKKKKTMELDLIERQGQVYIMFGYDESDELLELEVDLIRERE
jgi:hypothetical protein